MTDQARPSADNSDWPDVITRIVVGGTTHHVWTPAETIFDALEAGGSLGGTADEAESKDGITFGFGVQLLRLVDIGGFRFAVNPMSVAVVQEVRFDVSDMPDEQVAQLVRPVVA